MVFPIPIPSLRGDAGGAGEASTGTERAQGNQATTGKEKDAACRVPHSFRNRLNTGNSTEYDPLNGK